MQKYNKYSLKNKYTLFGGNKTEPMPVNNNVLYCNNTTFTCENNQINIDKFIQDIKNKSQEYCDAKSFRMIVGILHKNGDILYSLATTSPMGSDVHSEHSIIQEAYRYEIQKKKERGEPIIKENINFNDFVLLVCVNDSGVIKSPCGICRELLKHYMPNIFVILKDDIGGKDFAGTQNIGNIMIQAKYLLPYPYTRSKEMNSDSVPNQNVNIDLKIKDNNTQNPYTIREVFM
jgi:hypothetical protein